MMKSEKVTINLSTVELAQIDFLVEKGLYASRSDFIRLATRKQTESHQREIEDHITPSVLGLGSLRVDGGEEVENIWGLGVIVINQYEIERLALAKRKLDIRTIGLLKIAKDVNPEQFRQVLRQVKISGKVKAEPEIKAIIEEFNQES